MLRDKNLIPLSRQHQHALALCVRIERASPVAAGDLLVWQTEIAQQFEQEISLHFAAEERVVFPAARKSDELNSLVEELLAEHAGLRESFSQAQRRTLSATCLLAFAQQLAAHIRKEERQLFERMQQLMEAAELTRIGTDLEVALKDASQACILPSQVTKLQPKANR
jgi:hemerythrin-like domain-containing protein